MNKKFIPVIFLLSMSGLMAVERMLAETGKDKIKASLSVMIGSPFAASSRDFLDEYTSTLNGTLKSFSVTPAGTVRMKVYYPENWRFGISADYYAAWADDAFSQSTVYFTETIQRSLDEKFSITTIPVVLFTEYALQSTPYRNYAGMGVGLSFGRVLWTEDVYSSFEDDPRKSGTRVDENVVAPCFRIYSGVELDFDEKRDTKYLGSLILEASYTYVFRNVEMFKNLKNQFSHPPAGWDDSYMLLPGYIGLHAGISFKFFIENK